MTCCLQAQSSTVELSVVVRCHPGYVDVGGVCVVQTADNVVRRSTENRNIYIRVSVHMTVCVCVSV